MFSGALHYCSDPDIHEYESCTGTYAVIQTGLPPPPSSSSVSYNSSSAGYNSNNSSTYLPTRAIQSLLLYRNDTILRHSAEICLRCILTNVCAKCNACMTLIERLLGYG
eukprot:COSAG05_NODE_1395_length_4993_cov_6.265836_11_plen_109_part_00